MTDVAAEIFLRYATNPQDGAFVVAIGEDVRYDKDPEGEHWDHVSWGALMYADHPSDSKRR